MKKNKEEFEAASGLELLWNYINSKYDFLRDEVKERVLFKPKNSDIEYKEFDVTMLSTLTKDAKFAGLQSANVNNIKLLLNSNEVHGFNALQDYFENIKHLNPVAAIKRFCACVKTQNDEAFYKYFKKWCVASVANIYIKETCTNHTCLTITGGQGKGKSRLISYLIPQELLDYFNEDGFHLIDIKDDTIKLADYWIIHLEETIGVLNHKDNNLLKKLISLNSVKVRRPFAPLTSNAPRLANVIASVNADDFLTDHTGSRRYPSFKIFDINEAAYRKIDIDTVWAEAYHEFKKGFEYWTNQEDIKELDKMNNEFSFVSVEEQYIIRYFSKPKTTDTSFYYLQSSSVVDYLQNVTNNKQLSSIRIGRALSKLGFENISYCYSNSEFSCKVWKVKPINVDKHFEIISQFEASTENNYKP